METLELKNGKGKYDDLCLELRQKLNAAGVVLMVIEGDKGSGCSMQIRSDIAEIVPGLPRQVADGFVDDIAKMADSHNN